MKSSYYTGYEDLDNELSKLYQEQVQLEHKDLRGGGLSDSELAHYQDVIRAQDSYLATGKRRDEKK